jgi:glucose-1-phosphate cytidylyltransferase
VLCLGYRGDLIRDYFRSYDECLSNDFTLSSAGQIELHSSDTHDWRITFVDTGLHSNIGQRLLRVRRYLDHDSTFLANYADGLSDLPLDQQIADFEKRQVIASFASVCSAQSFHLVQADAEGLVTAVGPMQNDQIYINGGFFVFRHEIFDYIQEGEELVEQPFARLIAERRLATYRHTGFWQAMDTFKDKIAFDRMEARGDCPWMRWRPPNARAGK